MTINLTVRVGEGSEGFLRVVPDSGPAFALKEGEELEFSVWDGNGLRITEATTPDPEDVTTDAEDGETEH